MSREVALVLEGTYPYVPGGVSSWVHQILQAYPKRAFRLIHIGPREDFYDKPVFELPDNVVELQQIYCSGPAPRRRRATTQRGWSLFRRRPRVLRGLRRLHLEDEVDDEMLEDLCAGDLSTNDFLYGQDSFTLLRDELYPRLGHGMPFSEFFWHYRALHAPMLRLLNSEVADAEVYHAVSAGYAGLVGVVASVRKQRPFFLTEHGIYAREREIELARARWIADGQASTRSQARPSPLRSLWAHYFKMLSKLAYHRAEQVVTLSETNRRRQLRDGACIRKTRVVPNGVDSARYQVSSSPREAKQRPALRLGFVGRVVPIKDVITLLRAFKLASTRHPNMELWIVGPEDEDRAYAERCHALAEQLGLGDSVKFMGRQPMHEIYPVLDGLVLTSISEGQPLVILEAYANRVPVIASDVGACRELIEGSDEEDRKLGAAGITTRVANPSDTASALCFFAEHPETRKAMGEAGYARVTTRYQQQQVVHHYDELYNSMVSSWQA